MILGTSYLGSITKPDSKPRVVFEKNKFGAVLYFVFGLVFLLGLSAGVQNWSRQSFQDAIGLFACGFLGFPCLIIAINIFWEPEALIIYEAGLWIKGFGQVPWSDVVDCEFAYNANNIYLPNRRMLVYRISCKTPIDTRHLSWVYKVQHLIKRIQKRDISETGCILSQLSLLANSSNGNVNWTPEQLVMFIRACKHHAQEQTSLTEMLQNPKEFL